ncbi:alkaline phosphatase family protein [Brachybacterium sp. FME24]|uniref:alkaline phosphatase family protein n=1 Tax=Brachybacterium sp. FME24 TaxID=2742605 RepID=UPI001868E7B0|nr:ectonucleotide pyrophosphatase/phosphodiesterase [Brachybacterium sp. FME24]
MSPSDQTAQPVAPDAPAPRSHRRLVVISVDAMSVVDVPFARTLPNFARILAGGWGSAEAIYPTVTYPNHTSQTTARTVDGHGIYANEQVQVGERRPDWFWDARDITCPTIFDLAAHKGLTSASVGWPVTGWSPSIDIAVPEIWDTAGLEPTLAVLREAASPRGRSYVDRHAGEIGWDTKHRFGRFNTSVAVDMIRTDQPDVLFVHLVDVDSARHSTGRFTDEVREAFERVDGWIGEILDALTESGVSEDTNVAIVSDHGHVEVGRCFRANHLLVQEGLVRLDEDGQVASWDAWVHGCGLTGQLHLNPAADDSTRERVLALIEEWVQDPEIPVEAFHPLADMREDYGYDGPFIGILEGTSGTNFQNLWDGRSLYGRFDPDYTFLLSQHGHLPEQDIQAVFAMAGPDIEPGVKFSRCTVPDEAATFAHLLGLEFPEADGTPVTQILRVPAQV